MSIAAITFMQSLSGTLFPVFDYMIIDFGAKGLQASAFRLEVYKQLQTLSHAYTREMSGDAINDILFQHFEPFVREAWVTKQNASISDEGQSKFYQSTMQNLRNTVHQMKTQTNTASDIVGTVTLIPTDEDIEVRLTQSEFESLVRKDLKQWIKSTVESALKQASEVCSNLNLQYVRWTGGSSLLPLFQNIVKEFFRNLGMLYLFHLS